MLVWLVGGSQAYESPQPFCPLIRKPLYDFQFALILMKRSQGWTAQDGANQIKHKLVLPFSRPYYL